MKAMMVCSGKGGTGKTLIAANLAMMMSKSGQQVNLVDLDIRAPNMTYVLGIQNHRFEIVTEGNRRMFRPVEYRDNMHVFSSEILMPETTPYKKGILLRGEHIRSIVHSAFEEVIWPDGIFVIDTDPSTGDVLISLTEIFNHDLEAYVVSTNGISSVLDMERMIDTLMIKDIKIAGIIANQIYDGDTERLQKSAAYFHLPIISTIPYLDEVRRNNDNGIPDIPDFKLGVSPWHTL